MSTHPIDIIAEAFRRVAPRVDCEYAARIAALALTDEAIVANAVQALRQHSWTAGDVEEISDRDLGAIVRTVLHSVAGE